MPSETDQPIEKELREYAARRRAVAGDDAFALHPVTRIALQVEVRREFGRPGQSRRRQGWLAWWPRLAFAGGTLAVVALVAVLVLPRSEESQVGHLAKAGPAANVPELAGTDSAELKSEPPSALHDSLQTVSTAEALAEPTATTATTQEFQFTSRLARSGVSAPSSVAPSASAAPPVQLRTRAAEGARRETAANPTPATVSPQPTPVVLPLQAAFRVTLVDDVITIVDADDSSYTGRLQPVDPGASAGRSLSFEERYHKFVHGGVVQSVPVAAQFTLIGTNKTSRFPVQITGQMLTRTQSAPVQVSATRDATAAPEPAADGVFLQIQGTATVDGRLSYPIDASSEPK
jgi:hypothetical protein